MGWGSGVYVFDKVAKHVLYLEEECGGLGRYVLEEVLESVRDALEDQDWGTKEDSNYYDHPRIGKILGNDFEEDEDE